MAWLAAQKEGQENVVKISLRTKWICFAKTGNMRDNHGNFCLHEPNPNPNFGLTWLYGTMIKRMQQCYWKAMISAQIWTDLPIKSKTKWINRKYRFNTKGDFYAIFHADTYERKLRKLNLAVFCTAFRLVRGNRRAVNRLFQNIFRSVNRAGLFFRSPLLKLAQK